MSYGLIVIQSNRLCQIKLSELGTANYVVNGTFIQIYGLFWDRGEGIGDLFMEEASK